MRIVSVFEAFDGTKHDSEAECRAHEKANIAMRFVGLTFEQVNAAIERKDAELADAFEVVGAKIARARVADGDRKRQRPARIGVGTAPAPEETGAAETQAQREYAA